MSHDTSDKVIRLPLLVIFVIALIMIGLGIVGGITGQQIFRPELPPLENNKQPVTATVQQVTISPNTATADLVNRVQSSVLQLGQLSNPAGTIFSLTNDGLLVTSVALDAKETPQAIDGQGRAIPLSRVGTDVLFGLTYFRATDNVIVPLDIAQNNSAIGQNLVALGRNKVTLEPNIMTWQVNAYNLPDDSVATGVEKIMRGTPTTLLNGTPLLDESGRVAGIIVNAAQGIALPASSLRDSFNRAANNSLEKNPFTDLGLTLTYSFKPQATNGPIGLAAEIKTVTPNSIAASAGLRKNDRLLSIGDTPVTWNQNIATQLSAPLPMTLQIQRDGSPQTVTLQPND